MEDKSGLNGHKTEILEAVFGVMSDIKKRKSEKLTEIKSGMESLLSAVNSIGKS